LVVAMWSAALLAVRLDPDYTAGELLDHLMAWRGGGALYPVLGASAPYRVLNYPPLVLLMARGLSTLGVPALTAGRLVNGVGLGALVAAVAWWARARGVRGAALAGTLGLLGASFPLVYGAGQFHIELWAEAGTVWGFALLACGRGRTMAALAGAALAAACFAKQSQVVLALVALGWAWSRRREVLAEEPGLVRACGHEAVIDPFLTASLARRGVWDPGPFERSIGTPPLDLAVLPFDPRLAVGGAHAQRWTPGALAAFRRERRVAHPIPGEWIARW
jgi:hypothetical protein